MTAAFAMVIFAGSSVYASNGDSIYLSIAPPISTIESKSTGNMIYNAEGTMTISGNNLSTSKNKLRVISKRQITWSPDVTAASFLLDIGTSGSASYTAESGGTYYILLENKNYAVLRNASGNATLYD